MIRSLNARLEAVKMNFSYFLKLLGIAALAFSSACSVSFNNDLVTSHPDEIEAFNENMLGQFYAKNTDKILANAVDDMGFNADTIGAIYEFISESAKPDMAIAANRSFSQKNSQKFYVTVFHIPREKGREVVTITTSLKEGVCCELYGLHLNMQIGERYVMGAEEISAD